MESVTLGEEGLQGQRRRMKGRDRGAAIERENTSPRPAT